MSHSRTPKVFTWHIHGNYLLYLTQAHAEFYLPYNKERSSGYVGKTRNFPFGDNVFEVQINEVKNLDLDLILFQDDKQYLEDQYTLFSEKQQLLPKIYLEHDPPLNHPVQTKHPVDDPHILLVHVTYFNQLMWDNNRTPTTVIEHGVLVPENVSYKGELDKGIVMVNNLHSIERGQRRMGYDVFEHVRKNIPLDLVGMGSEEIGGLGEIGYAEVTSFLSNYRFFFNPIRYTSLGLSVCEAMSIGLPVIGLATTEMVRTVENNISGYIDTDIEALIKKMQFLIAKPEEARRLSLGAKEFARKRFSINRFTNDWEEVLKRMTKRST